MGKPLLRYTGLCCAGIILTSIGGAWASWQFADVSPRTANVDIPIHMKDFTYVPELPEDEVTFLKRIHDLLNNNYSNDIVPEESMDYIIETLDKTWDSTSTGGDGSFVGSMDPTPESKARIKAMFGDIIDFSTHNHLSFILKREDLVGSIDNEIALYSTLDPLDWSPSHWQNSVVGVYLSVFAPIIGEDGKTVVGYEQICDSLHGYCMEVQYMEGSNIPSFSTDHWRDELFYWHESYADPLPITGEDRYKYECYHTADGNYAYPGRTQSWYGWIIVPTNQWETGNSVGKRARQRLEEMLSVK